MRLIFATRDFVISGPPPFSGVPILRWASLTNNRAGLAPALLLTRNDPTLSLARTYCRACMQALARSCNQSAPNSATDHRGSA
jgi:hypothetical protein